MKTGKVIVTTVLVVVIVIIAIVAVTLSSRVTFASDTDMLNAIEGTWIEGRGIAIRGAVVIRNGSITEYEYQDEPLSTNVIVTKPFWGEFSAGNRTYIVKRGSKENEMLLSYDGNTLWKGEMSYLKINPDSQRYKDELQAVQDAVDAYISQLRTKNHNISYILTFGIERTPTDNFKVECEVYYSNGSPKKGVITVQKQNNLFTATGLSFY